MQDGTARDVRVVAQHRQEVAARIPLVQEERLVESRGEAELELERTALLGGRREVPEVVESALACRNHQRVAGELGEPRGIRVAQRRRVVRMHAGRRAQDLRMPTAERNGLLRVGEGRAGDDHRRDPRGACARQHRLAVRIEAVVGQVGADVDEHAQVQRPAWGSGGAQAPSSRAGALPAAPAGSRRPSRS